MSPDLLVQMPYICLNCNYHCDNHILGLGPDPKSPSSEICYTNIKIYTVVFCLFLGVRDSGNQEKRSGYAH